MPTVPVPVGGGLPHFADHYDDSGDHYDDSGEGACGFKGDQCAGDISRRVAEQ